MNANTTLVRYCPNFCGSPAWMPVAEAELRLKEDSALVSRLIDTGAATIHNFPHIQPSKGEGKPGRAMPKTRKLPY